MELAVIRSTHLDRSTPAAAIGDMSDADTPFGGFGTADLSSPKPLTASPTGSGVACAMMFNAIVTHRTRGFHAINVRQTLFRL